MRAAGSRRPGARSARRTNPNELDVPLDQLDAGLVPRLLAGDLGRRPPRPRRLHVRRRPEPRPGAAVRDPVDQRDGGDTAAARRPLARLPLADGRRSGCFVFRMLIARPLVRRVPGSSLRARLDRVRGRARRSRSSRTPVYVLAGDGEVRAALGLRRRRARAAHARVGVRARLPRPRARASRSSPSRPRSRSGSSARSGRSARSPSCSRWPARSLAAAAALARSPGSPATPRRRRRAASRSRSTGCTSSPASVWIGGLVGLLVLWVSLGAARRLAGARRLRPALLPRRLRLGDAPDRARARARRSSTCRRSPRSGRPRTGSRSLVKVALLAGAMLLASVNLARNTPRLAAAQARPSEARGGGDAAAPARGRRGRARRRGDLRRRRPLQPAAARRRRWPASAARAPASAPAPVTRDGRARTATGSTSASSPNRAAVPNAFSVAISKGGRACSRRGRHRDLHHARHGDGTARVPPARDRAGSLRRDRRPALVMVGHWGLSFEIRPRGAASFTVRPRRQGKRMSADHRGSGVPLNLVLALIALAAGAAAVGRRHPAHGARSCLNGCRLGLFAAVVAVMLVGAGLARADGDPASDVLYTGRVFLPYNTHASPDPRSRRSSRPSTRRRRPVIRSGSR